MSSEDDFDGKINEIAEDEESSNIPLKSIDKEEEALEDLDNFSDIVSEDEGVLENDLDEKSYDKDEDKEAEDPSDDEEQQ